MAQSSGDGQSVLSNKDVPSNGHHADTIPPACTDGEELLRVFDVAETLRNPPAPPPALVEGLLRVGEYGVLVADRGMGKSWAALNLAHLLARGDGRFLGQFPVARQARTLIVHLEIGHHGAATRHRQLCAEGAPPPERMIFETFDAVHALVESRTLHRDLPKHEDRSVRESVRANRAFLDPRIEHTIRDQEIDLLIIDPLAAFVRANENANDEMDLVLDELRGLTQRTGAALLLLHHPGKGGTGKSDRPEDSWRGASRIADWAVVRITMQRPKGSHGAVAEVRVLHRNERPIDAFRIEMDGQGWWNAAGSLPPIENKTLPETTILDALIAAGGEWPSTKQAAKALGHAEATVRQALEAAELAGRVTRVHGIRNSIGWRMTDAGWQASGQRVQLRGTSNGT